MHPREGWRADATPARRLADATPARRLADATPARRLTDATPARRLTDATPARRLAGLTDPTGPGSSAPGPGLSRRGFLARAAGAGLAAGGLSSLLAACGAATAGVALPEDIPTPRPDEPVAWPIYATNQPIRSGLLPERDATLKIYNWAGHINRQCLDDFGKKYRCRVELTTFSTMTQALAKLTSGRASFDVLMGVTPDALSTLIVAKLLMPLNHSYLPNISQAWPPFTNPFYDENWQYTVPYTIYTTGIAWRKDLVPQDPYAAANGWAFPWQGKYRGKVAILDDYREGISLGLLQSGTIDLNTTDPRLILTAQQALQELARLTSLRIDNNSRTEIPSGQAWIHQAWSGDIAAAARYLPKGMPVEVIGYWFPPDGVGPVANDTNTVLRGAQNPVLAHLFLNFLLDERNALTNIRANGYLQPLQGITPSRLVQLGILPASLISTAVLPSYFNRGLQELAIPVAADQLWQYAWQRVSQRG